MKKYELAQVFLRKMLGARYGPVGTLKICIWRYSAKKEMLCCRHCVPRGLHCQDRVRIHSFTEVNIWDFDVGTPYAVVANPNMGTSALSRRHNFSDSWDPIFIFRDPNQVSTTP